MDRAILIVDGNNLFIGSYLSNFKINIDGYHIDSILSFFRILNHVCDIIRPNHVIFVFDSSSSVQRKRMIYPEYKKNRTASSIIPYKLKELMGMSDEEALNHFHVQKKSILMYLQSCPVNVITIDPYESDEVISLLCKYNDRYEYVYILSNDSDFYQLLKEKIYLYIPFGKRKGFFINSENLKDVISVKPYNYALYKSIIGDHSDNIPGVNGIGKRNIFKYFPFFKEDKKIELDYLFSYCEENKNKSKILYSITNDKKKIKNFYDLISLDNIYHNEEVREQVIKSMNEKNEMNVRTIKEMSSIDKIDDIVLKFCLNIF